MISVIIPTYKNTKQLINNLKHNLMFLEGCEIIIINDDPINSLKQILSELKKVILIENQKNFGFGKSINQGVKKATRNIIMLLNDDVVLINDNFKNGLNLFNKDPQLFAISFAQKEKNGTIIGKNKIYWEKGFFQHKCVDDNVFGPNGWAEGGSCLISKNKFLDIGGFDEKYSPFYWEDIDLSYQAKRQGYQILFDPNIQVIHHHESTIGKYYSQNYIKEIAYRNQLIFIWKNINDKKLLLEHIFYLLPTTIKGGTFFIKGFARAIFFLPKIIINRLAKK